MRRTAATTLVVLAAVVFLAAQPIFHAQSARRETPVHHLEHGFRNLDPAYAYPLFERAKRLIRRTVEGRPERGTPLQVIPNDGVAIRANGVKPTLTWIGHSTFLVQATSWGSRRSASTLGRSRSR